MKINKYLPLVIAIIFGVILIPFLVIDDDGRYVVSYDEILPVKSNRPSKIKLYVENSGSMDGYMFNGSELKDAVYSYVSGLQTHSDTTELYFVNSGVYNNTAPLHEFINAMSPETFHNSPGNKANTDIADIFGMVLKQLEIIVLVYLLLMLFWICLLERQHSFIQSRPKSSPYLRNI